MDQLPGYEALSQMNDQQLKEIFGVRDFYVYELDFTSLAGAASTQGLLTIEADANFLWQQGAYFADIAGAAQTESSLVVPLVSCSIQDTGSGRTLMNANTPLTSVFGSGKLPYILPTPRFFRSQTTIKVNLLNFSAATAYVLKLQFIGTKFFKFAQAI